MTAAQPCDCGLHNDRETACTCDGRYRCSRPISREDIAATVREQSMVARFMSSDEDAAEIKRICEVAVAAFLTPSKESASALFELGAVAVVAEAQASRV